MCEFCTRYVALAEVVLRGRVDRVRYLVIVHECYEFCELQLFRVFANLSFLRDIAESIFESDAFVFLFIP